MDPAPPPPLLPDSPTQAEPTAAVRDLGHLTCNNCSGLGHLKRNCPLIRCGTCGTEGHFKVDCPQNKRSRINEEGDHGSESLRWEVCNTCGSSRHMQVNCPVRYQMVECHQCHQLGHLVLTCPQTRCYNCGTFGHSSQICQSRPYCFHCAHSGHRSADCPLKVVGRVCYQCNLPGHEAATCPKGQLCRMCHQPGHFIAHCPQAICHSCKEKGHTSSVCEKAHCANCGGAHETKHCRQVPVLMPIEMATEEEREREDSYSVQPPTELGDEPVRGRGEVNEDGGEDHMNGDGLVESACQTVPPYFPLTEKREGRVVIVIDGPYFERCVDKKGLYKDTPEYYKRTVDALQCTLDFIGDIFGMEPYAFWFDTDPDEFVKFVEAAVPLAHRRGYLLEAELRRKYLTDEMNGDHSLKHVIAKLVGGMKRQRGYTQDGPGHVWVQSGVDVSIATCVIEQFQKGTFDQVVLLAGDADLYPAVHFCNNARALVPAAGGVAGGKVAAPVRTCGTSSSIAKDYGQDQHLCDFLPRILLDKPSHVENKRNFDFPPYTVFH